MAANTPPASNADIIAQFLEAKGFSAAQTAGILGNLEVESGFNPAEPNPREGAIGIAQWEGGRRTALDAYAKQTGGSETSLSTQLGYLWSELTGPYKSVLTSVKQAQDPATAAAYWDVGPGGVHSGTGFENSSGSSTNQRVSDALAIYQRLAAGQSLGGISSPGGAASSGAAGFAGGSGVQANAPLPGGAWDPLNWPSMALSSAAGSILKVLLPYITKAVFVLGGLGLVVLGLYRASGAGNSGGGGAGLAKLAAAAA
jgi:hypothetical protein